MAGGIAQAVIGAEAWWFDKSRGVKTSGDVSLTRLTLAGRPEDGCMYMPARVSNVRRALRAVPVRDHASFTFVDLGSGKGRILFLAAEFPYRQIRGVEFAKELHLEALRNIRSHRGLKQRCREIESLYGDASCFEFPKGNLVVYVFNSFPPGTLGRVLENLRVSLERSPREVYLVLQYPAELAPVAGSMPWLEPVKLDRRHHIYRGCLLK